MIYCKAYKLQLSHKRVITEICGKILYVLLIRGHSSVLQSLEGEGGGSQMITVCHKGGFGVCPMITAYREGGGLYHIVKNSHK